MYLPVLVSMVRWTYLLIRIIRYFRIRIFISGEGIEMGIGVEVVRLIRYFRVRIELFVDHGILYSIRIVRLFLLILSTLLNPLILFIRLILSSPFSTLYPQSSFYPLFHYSLNSLISLNSPFMEVFDGP